MHHVRGSVPCPPGHWGDDLASLGAGKLMKLFDWILGFMTIVSALMFMRNSAMILWIVIFGGIYLYRQLKRQQVQ